MNEQMMGGQPPMPPEMAQPGMNQQMQPQGVGIQQMNAIQQQLIADLSANDIKNNSLKIDQIPKRLKLYMEMDNIAETLDDEQLENIAEICLDGFDIDKTSRHEWEEVMKKAFDLVDTGLKGKNTPWEGAANIKYPLVTGACIQFNARINPEIIKNDMVVEVRVMIPDDPNRFVSDRAGRLSAHMSYQLLCQSDHWVSDTDKLLVMLPMLGTVFRKSFFNPITGQPDTVLCMPEDVVINQKVQSLESAQRISHVLCFTNNDLISNMKAGLFKHYEMSELESSDDDTILSILDNEEDEIESRTPQSYTTKKDATSRRTYDINHEGIEQHRWLDLDGDGYQEPYIVTIHKGSRKVLRIVARYDETCFEFNTKGEFTKISSLNHFTDYHFIPNPNGNFYSLGFGRLLMPTNETVNSLLNQLIDAGTLANRQIGFIGSELRLPKGDFSFKPGEWKQVPSAPGSVIANSIVPLPIKEPSQTLFSLMQFLIESAKNITNVTDIMSGQLPPPNTPATSVMALMEQSQQIINGVLYRIYESLKKEFKKLYDINKKYLKDLEQFPMAEGIGMITLKDYEEPNYGVFPVADPKLSSSYQRMMQAQALLDMLKFPQVNVMAVLENYLKILKVSDPKQYLILNPPPSPDILKVIAETKNIDMQTHAILMDRELEAIKHGISEKRELSKAMYYGGQLASKKIDSMAKIIEMNQIASPDEIEQATQEEETLTQGTQQQSISPEQHSHLQALQKMMDDLTVDSQQIVMPPQQPQGGQMPPEGGQPMPE
jgi:chaperonin GroES